MKAWLVLWVAVLSATWPAVAAPPPMGSSAMILSPRFFPGWQMYNVSYPFVIQVPGTGKIRMYYAGSATELINDSFADQWVTGYVTSDLSDTINWTFPIDYEQVLFARRFMEGDVVDPDETANVFDSLHATGACLMVEGSTYKSWYSGWNGQTEPTGPGICRKINFRIGYATSSDGIHWSKFSGSAGAGAVLGLGQAGQADSKGAAHPHVLKIGGNYRMWYEGFDGTTWRLMSATSSNGQSWSKQGVALSPGGAGSLDERGLRNPLVLGRNGQYELWYQGQSTASPNFHILRATSPDALTWTKVPGQVTLHPDTPVSGNESILVDSAIVQADGKVQVFFAKETASSRTATYGTLTRKNSYIYTEVVNP
jgi:hypothetical protein